MTPFRAVIFDMDGVIVDSEPLHERAFLDVFEALGYGTTHGVNFTDYYGRSDEALWRDFIARHRPERSFDELLQWKRRQFASLLQRDQPIFDGLPELVEALAGRYPLAVASGSPHPVIEQVLALRGLRRFFGVTVSVYDVPRPKPAPDVFLRAAEGLGIAPETCCVIEDAAVGVAAAQAAGMFVVAITNSLPRERLAQADRVVARYDELHSLLLPSPA